MRDSNKYYANAGYLLCFNCCSMYFAFVYCLLYSYWVDEKSSEIKYGIYSCISSKTNKL